jgi:hypothetical protein
VKKLSTKYVRHFLLVLVSLPLFIVFLLLLSIRKFEIEDIYITNLTDGAATIVWTTNEPMYSKVLVSKNKNLLNLPFASSVHFDDREVEEVDIGEYKRNSESIQKRRVHHVTINNINPETTYYFKIRDGFKVAKIQIDSFETIKTPDTIKEPDPVYGRVLKNESNVVEDGVVFLSKIDEKNNTHRLFSNVIVNGTYALDQTYINIAGEEKLEAESRVEYIAEMEDNIVNGYISYDKDSYQPVADIFIENDANEGLQNSASLRSRAQDSVDCSRINASDCDDFGAVLNTCGSLGWCACCDLKYNEDRGYYKDCDPTNYKGPYYVSHKCAEIPTQEPTEQTTPNTQDTTTSQVSDCGTTDAWTFPEPPLSPAWNKCCEIHANDRYTNDPNNTKKIGQICEEQGFGKEEFRQEKGLVNPDGYDFNGGFKNPENRYYNRSAEWEEGGGILYTCALDKADGSIYIEYRSGNPTTSEPNQNDCQEACEKNEVWYMVTTNYCNRDPANCSAIGAENFDYKGNVTPMRCASNGDIMRSESSQATEDWRDSTKYGDSRFCVLPLNYESMTPKEKEENIDFWDNEFSGAYPDDVEMKYGTDCPIEWQRRWYCFEQDGTTWSKHFDQDCNGVQDHLQPGYVPPGANVYENPDGTMPVLQEVDDYLKANLCTVDANGKVVRVGATYDGSYHSTMEDLGYSEEWAKYCHVDVQSNQQHENMYALTQEYNCDLGCSTRWFPCSTGNESVSCGCTMSFGDCPYEYSGLHYEYENCSQACVDYASGKLISGNSGSRFNFNSWVRIVDTSKNGGCSTRDVPVPGGVWPCLQRDENGNLIRNEQGVLKLNTNLVGVVPGTSQKIYERREVLKSLQLKAYAQDSTDNNGFQHSNQLLTLDEKYKIEQELFGLYPGVYEIDSADVTTKNIQINSQYDYVMFFEDMNGNGVYDEGEMLLPNVSIEDLGLEFKKVADVQNYRFTVGWNFFSFPMNMQTTGSSNIEYASDLLEYLNNDTNKLNATHVVTFRSGKLVVYTNREVPEDMDSSGLIAYGKDFKILPGEGYIIKSYGIASVGFVGNRVEGSIPLDLQKGWNLVGVYNHKDEKNRIFSGFEVLSQIQKQAGSEIEKTTLSKWDDGTYLPIVLENGEEYGNDFAILPYSSYWIKLDGAGVKYTPEGDTLDE